MGQISRHRGQALLPQVMRRTPIYAADMKPVGARLARDDASLNNKIFRVYFVGPKRRDYRSSHSHVQRIARHAMTATSQEMPLQYDRYALHTPVRMPFDEGEFALMQWACSLVPHHRRCFAVNAMRTFKLAEHDRAAAAGGIA